MCRAIASCNFKLLDFLVLAYSLPKKNRPEIEPSRPHVHSQTTPISSLTRSQIRAETTPKRISKVGEAQESRSHTRLGAPCRRDHFLRAAAAMLAMRIDPAKSRIQICQETRDARATERRARATRGAASVCVFLDVRRAMAIDSLAIRAGRRAWQRQWEAPGLVVSHGGHHRGRGPDRGRDATEGGPALMDVPSPHVDCMRASSESLARGIVRRASEDELEGQSLRRASASRAPGRPRLSWGLRIRREGWQQRDLLDE